MIPEREELEEERSSGWKSKSDLDRWSWGRQNYSIDPSKISGLADSGFITQQVLGYGLICSLSEGALQINLWVF